jgi:predicted ferric reductase
MDLSNSSKIWMSIGQAAGLVGFSFYALNIILSARLRFIEPLFFGLNRVYIFHHLLGIAAFICLLYHPLTISVSYLSISLQAAAALLIPNTANLPVYFGIVSLTMTIVLLILTLYFKLEYDFWKKTHQYLGLALFLASLHVLFIGSTLDKSPFLKSYFIILILCSLSAYVYRTLLGKYLVRRRPFLISKNFFLSTDILEIVLRPADGKPFTFHPGQFIFLKPEVKGIPRQSHPFSLSSPVGSSDISVTVKSVGDFTETLKLLTPDKPVLVEGPFGRFGYDFSPAKKQLWIAGGIGITPFVSLGRSLAPDDPRTIDLYYLVRDESEAVYSTEFEELAQRNPNFHFVLHNSKTNGRLTADAIAAKTTDLLDREIFICGPPPLMTAFKTQFRKLKVRSSRVHTEEFSLN